MEGKPLVILLAEDNPSHTRLVMRGLEQNHFSNQVFCVSDGEQALDFLHHRGDYTDAARYPRPDLLLLDLRLPRVDGLEVLKQVKSSSELQTLPVVILTTSEAESDISRAYELKANSYLVKPIDFDRFSDLIRDLGFYWLAWNQPPFRNRPLRSEPLCDET